MLNENIKALRKAKGLSQEELAIKLNVVRQTVSKWEKGLSVPDAGIIIQIAEVLDTTVSILLGEEIPVVEDPDLTKTLAAKLEVLNEQYSKQKEQRRKIWRAVFITVLIVSVISLIRYLLFFGSIYLMKYIGDTSVSASVPAVTSCFCPRFSTATNLSRRLAASSNSRFSAAIIACARVKTSSFVLTPQRCIPISNSTKQ